MVLLRKWQARPLAIYATDIVRISILTTSMATIWFFGSASASFERQQCVGINPILSFQKLLLSTLRDSIVRPPTPGIAFLIWYVLPQVSDTLRNYCQVYEQCSAQLNVAITTTYR